MITYVYRCSSCEHEFEEQQRITADPLVKCPKCKKNALERVVQSAGGFRIGGMGVTNPTAYPGH